MNRHKSNRALYRRMSIAPGETGAGVQRELGTARQDASADEQTDEQADEQTGNVRQDAATDEQADEQADEQTGVVVTGVPVVVDEAAAEGVRVDAPVAANVNGCMLQ